MTKFDPVGSLTTSPAIDLRHAEALFGLLAPLLRQLIDVAVAAALQQYCDEQRSNEPDVLNLTQFCKRNNMGKTYFYQLVKDGLAPEFMLYGKEYRITIAAETAWRAKKHERAKSEEVQLERARRTEANKELGKKAAQSEKHVCRRPAKGRRKGARS